jgi:hypothetical protein
VQNNIYECQFSVTLGVQICLRDHHASLCLCGERFQTLHWCCVLQRSASESLIMRITAFLLLVLVCADGNKLIIADINDTDIISNFFITFPSREKNCGEGKVWSPVAKRCVIWKKVLFNRFCTAIITESLIPGPLTCFSYKKNTLILI